MIEVSIKQIMLKRDRRDRARGEKTGGRKERSGCISSRRGETILTSTDTFFRKHRHQQ